MRSDATRVTFPTCRKEHGKCDICEQTIKPGEQYIRIAIPPWYGEMDVDSNDDWPYEGGSKYIVTYINTHKWEVHETHQTCEEMRREDMNEAMMDLEWEDMFYPTPEY